MSCRLSLFWPLPYISVAKVQLISALLLDCGGSNGFEAATAAELLLCQRSNVNDSRHRCARRTLNVIPGVGIIQLPN